MEEKYSHEGKKELLIITKELKNEIEYLKSENKKKTLQLQNADKAIHELYDACADLITYTSKLMGDVCELEGKNSVAMARGGNLKYEISDPRDKKEMVFYPYIVSRKETIQKIIEERKSIARFGDGEFSCIANIDRQKFQKNDEKLSERLNQVLHSTHPDLLIAIADNYGNLEKYTDHAADGIRFYMTDETRSIHRELLELERVYYNAYITRPYVMYRDNQTEAPKLRFEMLKKIWANRKIVIIEGSQTRMGVKNDLFESAANIKRILAPAINSFQCYDKILEAALKLGENEILYLIAMGPAAGVLAHDLTLNGYQAIDIGHVDLEYEWYLTGKGERVPIPYKYNNEYKDGNKVEDINDPDYEKQIIFSCE